MLYQICLFFLALCYFPKMLWQRLAKGKYKSSLAARLGLKLPPKISGPLLWLHAVSYGETNAAIPLIKKIKSLRPDLKIALSSVTETGHKLAKSIPEVDLAFFLPFDFKWNISRLLKRIRPDVFISVESDFWYNLLRKLKKMGVHTYLVNGHMSPGSFKLFKRFPRFSKKLLHLYDHLCIQDELLRSRFLHLGVPERKLSVAGNLKCDLAISSLDEKEKNALRKRLGIAKETQVITIASTHHLEENLLLEKLFLPDFKFLVVPRHPERFKEVYALLSANYPVGLLSKGEIDRTVLVVDAMGMLTTLFQISTIAVLGGSFVPGIGGHNLFEPLSLGLPTFFGPYMEKQTLMAQSALKYAAGIQVPLEKIAEATQKLLAEKNSYRAMQRGAEVFVRAWSGAVEKTVNIIKLPLVVKNDAC